MRSSEFAYVVGQVRGGLSVILADHQLIEWFRQRGVGAELLQELKGSLDKVIPAFYRDPEDKLEPSAIHKASVQVGNGDEFEEYLAGSEYDKERRKRGGA